MVSLSVPGSKSLTTPLLSTSIIVPCHNAESTLQQQLDALLQQRRCSSFEVLLVDNRSSDASQEIARNHVLHQRGLLKVVEASHRLGVNSARNEGLRAAQGEFLLICDADDVVDPDWVHAFQSAYRVHNFLHPTVFTGPTIPFNGLEDLKQEAGVASFACFRGIPYAIGANMAFSRRTLEVMGPFDEEISKGFDEVEWWLRQDPGSVTLVWIERAVVKYRISARKSIFLRKRFNAGAGMALGLSKIGKKKIRLWKRYIENESKTPNTYKASSRANRLMSPLQWNLGRLIFWTGYALLRTRLFMKRR